MYCSKCGSLLPPEAKFCTQCGSSFAAVKKKCMKCKNEYDAEMIFCDNCGTLLDSITKESGAPSYLMQLSVVSYYTDISAKIPKSIVTMSFFNERIEFVSITESNKLLNRIKGTSQNDPTKNELMFRDIESVEESSKIKMPCMIIRLKDGNACAFAKVGTEINGAITFIKNHISKNIFETRCSNELPIL